MARKSQHTFSKRQREQRKAQKAAEKRVRREERLNPSQPPPDALGVGEATEDGTEQATEAPTGDQAPVQEDNVSVSE